MKDPAGNGTPIAEKDGLSEVSKSPGIPAIIKAAFCPEGAANAARPKGR